MRVNCPLPQIKWCWVFQARGCRTRRCSISAPLVTSPWTDARRTEPAGKLEILPGLPLSPMPCPWLRPQNQKEFLGQSQIANWLKYKISKYLHRQIEIFLRISIFYLTEILHGSNKVTGADLIPSYLSDPMLPEWVSVRGRRSGERSRERELNQTLFIFIFRPYLESVKSRCVDSCSRDRCMASVREFYRKIPKQHSLDIAFCLCK